MSSPKPQPREGLGTPVEVWAMLAYGVLRSLSQAEGLSPQLRVIAMHAVSICPDDVEIRSQMHLGIAEATTGVTLPPVDEAMLDMLRRLSPHEVGEVAVMVAERVEALKKERDGD